MVKQPIIDIIIPNFNKMQNLVFPRNGAQASMLCPLRFDFHPIHVFLNSTDGREYRRLKSENSHISLSSLDIRIAERYLSKGVGTQSYLKEVLSSKNRCIGLDEI